jgi:hypothetical protein
MFKTVFVNEEAGIAMETSNHSSNGVSPKNQMSRGNFLRKLCFAFLAAGIIFAGCGKDNGKDDDNGDDGNGNGGGTNAGYDYTILPTNLKIVFEVTAGMSGYTGTLIKIGNDFYYEEYMGTIMGIRLGSAAYLKHSGGTWTEYKQKDLDKPWEAVGKTYKAAEVKNRLISSNDFLSGFVTKDYLEGTKSAGEKIVGLDTDKYTWTNAQGTYVYWYNTQYKLVLKTTSTVMNMSITATEWNTSVTGFGDITLP